MLKQAWIIPTHFIFGTHVSHAAAGSKYQSWFPSGCFNTPQLEGTLNLDGLLLLIGLDGQHHLHFLAGGGVRDLVDLGKILTDVHECFIFGLGQDDIKIDGGGDAYGHEHQEDKRLQRLLRGQKESVRWDGDQTQQVRTEGSALPPHRYLTQVGLRSCSLRCFV